MGLDTKINFGRYYGRSIEAIWTGINSFNEDETISKYLFQLCSFLLNINNINEIPCSKFELTSNREELLFFYQSNVAKKINIRDRKIFIETEDEKINIALFKTLSNILTRNFKTIPQYYCKNFWDKSIGHSLNSINFQFLQADPRYIVWCIENKSLDSFFLNPSDLEALRLKECRYFSHFEFSKISESIFYYNPIFELSNFVLSEATILSNEDKYLRREQHNASFDCRFDEINFCAACHESPCMCSDREQSSSIYDF